MKYTQVTPPWCNLGMVPFQARKQESRQSREPMLFTCIKGTPAVLHVYCLQTLLPNVARLRNAGLQIAIPSARHAASSLCLGQFRSKHGPILGISQLKRSRVCQVGGNHRQKQELDCFRKITHYAHIRFHSIQITLRAKYL